MKKGFAITGVAIVAIAAGVGGGYWFAMHRMNAEMSAQAAAEPPPGRKPLYWHDPMVPQQKFDKPGKSPFMDMQLVPVYGDEGAEDSSVRISSRVVQNLGIRTAEATKGNLSKRIEAVGAVAFDERAVAVVQARVSGYVERLLVRAPLDPVAQGQPLVEILAPDWVAAQEEYLALRRSPQADAEIRRAARQRLVLLGMAESTIAAIEADGRTRPRITLAAPIGGVVAELGAREGMTVMPGAMLFRINALNTVWVNAEVPESQAAAIMPGNAVEATVAAYPGEKFRGRIAALLPEVSQATRTIKARIELSNPNARLKPGMFATINFAPQEKREILMVPSEAVIRTGQRAVVVVADTEQDGKQAFKPIDVEIGDEAGGMTEIRKGLEPGMKVVVSGQFLIDSEASLKTTATRMAEAPATEGATHHGEGRVEKVDRKPVALSHGPIASMQWGAMTMGFKLPKEGAPGTVREGTMVEFDFRATPDGEFEITAIAPRKAQTEGTRK